MKATLVPENTDMFLGRLPIVTLSLPNFEFIVSIVLDNFFLFSIVISKLLSKYFKKLV